MALFWCLYCLLWTYVTPWSSVFIVSFEQVNAGRAIDFLPFRKIFAQWEKLRKKKKFQQTEQKQENIDNMYKR